MFQKRIDVVKKWDMQYPSLQNALFQESGSRDEVYEKKRTATRKHSCDNLPGPLSPSVSVITLRIYDGRSSPLLSHDKSSKRQIEKYVNREDRNTFTIHRVYIPTERAVHP
jgi:hypothetical protein